MTDQQIPARPKCYACSDICRIDYKVADWIWNEAIPQHQRRSYICINCLAKFADEKMLPWCQEIELRPISMYRQLEIQRSAPTGNQVLYIKGDDKTEGSIRTSNMTRLLGNDQAEQFIDGEWIAITLSIGD